MFGGLAGGVPVEVGTNSKPFCFLLSFEGSSGRRRYMKTATQCTGLLGGGGTVLPTLHVVHCDALNGRLMPETPRPALKAWDGLLFIASGHNAFSSHPSTLIFGRPTKTKRQQFLAAAQSGFVPPRLPSRAGRPCPRAPGSNPWSTMAPCPPLCMGQASLAWRARKGHPCLAGQQHPKHPGCSDHP